MLGGFRYQGRGMAHFRTRFTRKLHVAFGVMLLITLCLAWYFMDSVKWYQYDVQRIAMSNNVLQAYQEVSNLTFRELNALGEAVVHGEAENANEGDRSSIALRAAISRVRQGIAAEVAFDANAGEEQELEALVEIERLVEEVIRSGAGIRRALADGRIQDAEADLERLRTSGLAGHFSNLVAITIEEQRQEARGTGENAIALADYITKVLPIFMSVLAVLTLFMVYLFSRSLSRSVTALHEGATAFADGELSHRIPELRETEFVRLGKAFNTMARELASHRAELHNANVRLEAEVQERTSALQKSNQKLAALDANRRRLLADISHELRTPLTVIRGESEISLRGTGKAEADYRAAFERILNQADHTTRLVDDLLFIARADSGEPRLDLRPVAIGKILHSVCADFGSRADQKNVAIECLKDGTKAVVLADPGRLRQVFSILMDNALRYSNPEGKVEVGMARVGADIEVTFRDHGIGLTAEEARQVFERFYRGSNAELHAHGTGLGLPVAKAIVEAHGGRISLEGVLGEGATARVILPCKDKLRAVA